MLFYDEVMLSFWEMLLLFVDAWITLYCSHYYAAIRAINPSVRQLNAYAI
jgi:hypothetical protein